MRCNAYLSPTVLALLVLASACARAAGTDEATEALNALYGADLARVRGTGDARDDVELAARLLAAAKRASDQPALVTVLCEKAYDLALRHPTGYGTALEAMDLLARSVPEREAACAARTFEIRQMQYDAAQGDEKKAAGELLLGSLLPVIEAKQKAGALAGAAALYRKARTIAVASGSPRAGEIDARAEALAQQMKTAARIADVKALLARDPANVSAREGLVRIYLVDLDDPAEAAKHLEGAKDTSLLKYVPAAAKGVEAPPELACLELGEWYARLATKAPKHARGPMYARAKAYLERFLTIHTSKDLNRTRATLAIEKVQEAVAKLTAPPTKPTKPTKPSKPAEPGVTKPGKWVDLLPLVDPAQDAVAGTWQRKGSAIGIPTGQPNGRITVPVLPQGNYELQGRFARTAGDGPVVIILPVGSSSVSLVFSGGGGVAHGLAKVNGQYETGNETAFRPGTLQNGREYAFHARVLLRHDLAQVTAALDGVQLFTWQGPQSALSLHRFWTLPQQGCLGLVAGNMAVTWHDLRLRMLSGQAKLLRPAGEPAPAGPATTMSSGWSRDLLPLVDTAKDALDGTWQRRGSALALTSPTEGACIRVPVIPQGNYEVQIRFVRNSGDDTVTVVLPVGSARIALCLSHGHGKASGLDQINGIGATRNQSSARPGMLINGREYLVGVKVSADGPNARIQATLDGKPLMHWQGPQSALGVIDKYRVSPRGCLGLGGFHTTVTFLSARLKMLSGEARLLRQ